MYMQRNLIDSNPKNLNRHRRVTLGNANTPLKKQTNEQNKTKQNLEVRMRTNNKLDSHKVPSLRPLSSAEAPISVNRKRENWGAVNGSARNDGKREILRALYFFPSTQPPRAFSSVQSRHDCRRPLRRREV